MSIYGSIPGLGDLGDNKALGAPWVYQGSHILPAEDDPRGGAIALAVIPSHITRDGRDDQPEDGRPWPWLRVSVDADDGTVLLSPAQARHHCAQVTAWVNDADPRTAPDGRGEPLDIDQYWPKPLSRDQAAERLANIIPPEYLDTVWDELIAPLYDARRFASEWPRGTCYRCHVRHPEYPIAAASRRTGRHRMLCPKYVGPLTHRSAHSHLMAFGSLRHDCTCGKSYPDQDDGGQPGQCPDQGLDWRGPRSGTDEETDG